MNDSFAPRLARVQSEGVAFYTDERLFEELGIRVAFSERSGGVSPDPYRSLNLGLHVGDDEAHVQENRRRFTRAVGLSEVAARHVFSARQVHGTHVATIDDATLRAAGEYPLPIQDTDALMTDRVDTPLLLCFADCLPLILVHAHRDRRSVAVVHSGWRGTLADITRETLSALLATYEGDPERVYAYIGSYIGPRDFAVTFDVASQFASKFDTLSNVISPQNAERFSVNSSGERTVSFDLADAVCESLLSLGVLPCNIVSLGVSTVTSTDRFFSYRAENGITGRHGALACLC